MKLTESKLKKAPASKYMNTDQLDFFKEKLISQKIWNHQWHCIIRMPTLTSIHTFIADIVLCERIVFGVFQEFWHFWKWMSEEEF